jgi:hypothetical protein
MSATKFLLFTTARGGKEEASDLRNRRRWVNSDPLAQAVKGGLSGSCPAGPPGGPTTAESEQAAAQTTWHSILSEFPGVTQPFTIAS